MSNRRIKNLSNPRMLGDAVASFTVERADGASFDIDVDPDNVGDMLAFLLNLVRHVAPPRPEGFKRGDRIIVQPVDVDGIAFVDGDPDPERSRIVIQIGGFPLTFSVANSAVQQFGREIGRTAQAMAAPRGRKN